MMKIRCQSEKLTKTSFDEGSKVAAKSAPKVEKVISVSRAASRAIKSGPESAFQVLNVVMKECCFIKITSVNELEDLQELKTNSALHQNAGVVVVDPARSTRSARGQASSAHDVFRKDRIEDNVRFWSNLMAPVEHGQIFCFDLMLFY